MTCILVLLFWYLNMIFNSGHLNLKCWSVQVLKTTFLASVSQNHRIALVGSNLWIWSNFSAQMATFNEVAQANVKKSFEYLKGGRQLVICLGQNLTTVVYGAPSSFFLHLFFFFLFFFFWIILNNWSSPLVYH